MSEYFIYIVFHIENHSSVVYFVYIIIKVDVFITNALSAVSDDPNIIKTLSLLGELHFEILYYLVYVLT